MSDAARARFQQRATFRSEPGHRMRLGARRLGLLLAFAVAGCSDKAASVPSDASSATADGGDAAADTGAPESGHAGDGIDCTPILNQGGGDTGFAMCTDGTKQRRAVVQCPLPPTSNPSNCPPSNGDCASDAECTQGTSAIFPKGYCADAHDLRGYCGCYYGCRQDSDCAPGSICECGVVVGQCVPANCKTNTDCGEGFACVATFEGTAGACNPVTNPFFPPLTRYVCQTAADQCQSDGDCSHVDAGPPVDARLLSHIVCLFDGTRRACGLACASPP